MPDKNVPDDKKSKQRNFISEKIVKQPRSKKELAKRGMALLLTAAIFGVVAAVTFVVSKPVAEKYLTKVSSIEYSSVTIPKDDPDTTEAAETETAPTKESQPIEELLQSAIKNYSFTMDDLNALYGNLRAEGQKADNGIVTVHSVKKNTDLFNNPIENSGLFAGAVIATSNDELLILTPEGAVEEADSIRVAFSDGTEAQGTIKQTDKLSGMAIVSVPTSELGRALLEEVHAIELGNSYSVKQGDLLLAVGSPAGMVHSTSYGAVSYIARNVQVTDGITRIIYADLKSNAGTGTFLLNTSGQMIGWVTDAYKSENGEPQTVAMAISDYKSILERMSNGAPFPYFGIKGQEVSAAMNESGLPLGVYVVDVNADSPAYNAGIQSGDILTAMGGESIVTMKDFQAKLESAAPGEAMPVTVERSGKGQYKKIQYQITIGARS